MQLPLYDCNVRIRNSVIPAILKSRQHHDRKTTRLRFTTCEFSPVIIEAGCAVLSVRSLFPDATDHIRRVFLHMSSSTIWMHYNSAWRHDVRHLPRVRPPYHPLQCSEPIQRPHDLDVTRGSYLTDIGVGCAQLIHPESVTQTVSDRRHLANAVTNQPRTHSTSNNPTTHKHPQGHLLSPGATTKSPDIQSRPNNPPARSLIGSESSVSDSSPLEVFFPERCFPGASHQTQSANTFDRTLAKTDWAPPQSGHPGLITTELHLSPTPR